MAEQQFIEVEFQNMRNVEIHFDAEDQWGRTDHITIKYTEEFAERFERFIKWQGVPKDSGQIVSPNTEPMETADPGYGNTGRKH
jgi:hypothetical protein